MLRHLVFVGLLCVSAFAIAEEAKPLVDRIDAVVAKVKERELRTDKATPWVVMHAVIAFEGAMTVTRPDGSKMNAIDFLLTEAKDGDGSLYNPNTPTPSIRTRDISPGFKESFILQDHVDQFLMSYADAGVGLDRAGRAGDRAFTVKTLLDGAMSEFKPTQELGWTLVATSTWLAIDARWKTDSGVEMGIEDIIKLAVKRDPNRETEGGTHHLYGIAYALNRYRAANPGKPLDGAWAEARAYLDKYVAIAKELQNEDGSLNVAAFRGQAITRTPKHLVWATGHTIEWLTLSLEPEQLREAWMTKAVQRLTAEMEVTPIDALSDGGVYHAAHAMRLWRQKTVAGDAKQAG